MSNETCTVTIADIYGEGWWERNKAELDREWEYELGVATEGQEFVCLGVGSGINSARCFSPRYEVRIILHRRKPKPPTLREVYGTDEVSIPVGWEWTGEWRVPLKGDHFQSGGCMTLSAKVHTCNQDRWFEERLILRKRQPKVWFKAEDGRRCPKQGEWNWDEGTHSWRQALCDFVIPMLCATRHEEIDQTVQVVTQAMVDEVVKNA